MMIRLYIIAIPQGFINMNWEQEVEQIVEGTLSSIGDDNMYIRAFVVGKITLSWLVDKITIL